MTRLGRRVLVLALAVAAAAGVASAQGETPPQDDERYQAAVREMLDSPAGLAFLDAYIAMRRDYLYGVDSETLFEGATAGLVQALADPFSSYLDAEEAEASRLAGSVSAVEVARVGDIGLIRIGTFEGDEVGARFSLALDALLGSGSGGIVLDLRGNAGGSILQGLQVLDRFIAEGELGYRRVHGVSVPIAYANPRAVTNPLVVLVDGETASTAEIVAGTLQAYGRARLVGSTTAGKGVGQTTVRLADGAELRLVSFEWLLPGMRSIDSVGLTPDLFVSTEPPDPVTNGEQRPMVAVPEEGGDPSLRLAIEVLRGLLGDELASNTIPVPKVVVSPIVIPDHEPDADGPGDDEAPGNEEPQIVDSEPGEPRNDVSDPAQERR